MFNSALTKQVFVLDYVIIKRNKVSRRYNNIKEFFIKIEFFIYYKY
jgi:hypothetical protein